MSSFEARGADIGARVSIIAVEANPGDGPALHRHPYTEVFVVLEGEAVFTLGGTSRTARGGDVVVAPAGIPHKFMNCGRGILRQIDIHENPEFQTDWL
jgi:quercetin dioxygenase-like cupin family protein